jgi:hypothetical protein
MASELMMAMGMSRCGFLASSAAVDTASNPTKARKTMAAAVITPPNPKGMKGCHRPGLTCQTVRTMKKTITASLTMTMIMLMRELSLTPRIRRMVRSATIKTAGMLMTAPVETNLWSVSLHSRGALVKAVGTTIPQGRRMLLRRLVK